MLTGEVVVIPKDRYEELLRKEQELKYMEPYGAYVVDQPQPAVVWALFAKENGKRCVTFSYDGPPSPAYIKLIDERKFQAFIDKLKELAGTEQDLTWRQNIQGWRQALKEIIKEFTDVK